MLHYENISFERVPTLWIKNGVSFPTFDYFCGLSFLEKISKMFCPRYATFSLVPDYDGHKPKRSMNIMVPRIPASPLCHYLGRARFRRSQTQA